MAIYVVNGVRTSAGPGPGPMTLPISEANALIGMRFAVPGSRAPNTGDPEPTVRRFGAPPAQTAPGALELAGGSRDRPNRDPGQRGAVHVVRMGRQQEILQTGELIDVDPGSALETAIGAANLTALNAQQLADAANGGAGAVSN